MMKKNSRIVLVLVLVMGLVLTMVACDRTEKPGTNNAAPTANEQQKEKNEVSYKVGTEPTFPPFEFLDKQTQEITGFDVELIKAIAEESGIKVDVQNLGFDALIPALQSGTIDIIASGMTIDDRRKEQVDFTKPYINSGLAIAVAKSNSTIKSEADLEGTKVAVQIGTTGAKKALNLKSRGLVKKVMTYDTVDVLMAELAKGTVDAVINDLPVTLEFINKGHDEIKIVGEPMDSEQYGFAVAKGNTELLAKLDAGLKKVMENGKYAELMQKYNLPENAWPK
jgi:ABC-type amino acid transport substrate-binding protein